VLLILPKKRKSGGRTKGKKGRGYTVQCSQCGRMVPRDKAKKQTQVRGMIADPVFAKELRKSGTYIPRNVSVKWYCISCAVHRKVVKVRSESERKSRGSRR
jgi:small subunit ribosomal protein S26e